MRNWESARLDWDRQSRLVASRARGTGIVLGVTAAMHLANVGVAMWRPDAFDTQVSTLELGVLVLTAIVFLRWLHRAIDVAGTISNKPLRWTPSRAVWSFFIPVISLWRPYQVLRDLHDQLAPNAVPEPAPRPRPETAGYRDVPFERPPPPRTLHHASIGLWWALFLIGGVSVNHTSSADAPVTTVLDLLSFGGAVLAALMVRAIDSRFTERFRRVRNASDAELEAWEIRA